MIEKSVDCKTDLVTEVITRHVPEAKLHNDIGVSLTYGLPQNMTQNFEGLFQDIDYQKNE